MRPKTLSALILTAFLLVVMAQNTQVVTLRLLVWEIILPQIVLIFFVLLIGFLLGFVAASRPAMRRKSP